MDELNNKTFEIGMAIQNIAFAVANTEADERVLKKLTVIENNVSWIVDRLKERIDGNNKNDN